MNVLSNEHKSCQKICYDLKYMLFISTADISLLYLATEPGSTLAKIYFQRFKF